MRKFSLLNIIGFACLLMCVQVYAEIDVQLMVEGCNNDTVCQIDSGENINSCPNDCTVVTPPTNPSTPIPSSEQPSGPIFGTNENWQFYNLKITYTEDSVILTWQTTRPTQSTVGWGVTDDYSNGSVSEIGFVKDHVTKITNIIPGRKYFFNIRAHDGFNVDLENIYSDTFLLQKINADTPPLNVWKFRSYTTTTGIGLRWENPNDSEYSYVRIVRSSKDYPVNFSDGKIVYEGRGQSVVDIDVEDDVQYYYAAFVRGANQTYSSGVLLTATKYKNGITPLESQWGFPYGTQPINISHASSSYTLPIENIDFIQFDEKISFIAPNVLVDAHAPLTMRINNSEWPILYLTISTKNQSQIFSQLYLVNINPKNSKLEVNIPAFGIDQPVSYSLHAFYNGSFYQLNSGTFNTFFTSEYIKENLSIKTSQKWKELLFILPIIVLLLILKRFFSKKKNC